MPQRIPSELEEKILAMPGVLVNGKPIAKPEPVAVNDIDAEKAFQATLIKFAKPLGWSIYHTFDSRRSNKGFPDLVMVRGDRIIFAELKSATGRLMADQESWIELLRGAGQVVYVWRPANWPEIKEVLA